MKIKLKKQMKAFFSISIKFDVIHVISLHFVSFHLNSSHLFSLKFDLIYFFIPSLHLIILLTISQRILLSFLLTRKTGPGKSVSLNGRTVQTMKVIISCFCSLSLTFPPFSYPSFFPIFLSYSFCLLYSHLSSSFLNSPP